MKKLVFKISLHILSILAIIIWNFGGAFLCNLLHLTRIKSIIFMLIWGGTFGIVLGWKVAKIEDKNKYEQK